MQLLKYLPALLLACLLPALANCSKKDKGMKESKVYDLHYGSDPRHLMDVYLPAGRNTRTPFILLIHGGGWTLGSKADMNFVQESLLKQGIASASMSYRYASDQVHYADMMQDVQAALSFCTSMHETWNIKADRYLIGGFSAGAHMSLLYAYAYDSTRQIAAVFSAAGPTDITQTDFLENAATIGLLPQVELMAGATYMRDKPLNEHFGLASPRTHIRNVPTLLIHGDQDHTIPYRQSQLLSDDLAAAGIPHRLVTLENAPHNMNLVEGGYLERVMNEIAEWCMLYGK